MAASTEISTALLTVVSPDFEVSNARAFTITTPIVAAASSNVSTAGTAVTVTTAPTTSGAAGVTAVLDNGGSTSAPTATIAVANYTTNAASLPYFDAGGGYVDVQVLNDETRGASAVSLISAAN